MVAANEALDLFAPLLKLGSSVLIAGDGDSMRAPDPRYNVGKNKVEIILRQGALVMPMPEKDAGDFARSFPKVPRGLSLKDISLRFPCRIDLVYDVVFMVTKANKKITKSYG